MCFPAATNCADLQCFRRVPAEPVERSAVGRSVIRSAATSKPAEEAGSKELVPLVVDAHSELLVSKQSELRIDVGAANLPPAYVTYSDVEFGSESDYYRLRYRAYVPFKSTTGDELCSDCQFYTPDEDTTAMWCAQQTAGWMETNGTCTGPRLFAQFIRTPYMRWPSYSSQLNYVDMKFRPSDFDTLSYVCDNPCKNNATCRYSEAGNAKCQCRVKYVNGGLTSEHCIFLQKEAADRPSSSSTSYNLLCRPHRCRRRDGQNRSSEDTPLLQGASASFKEDESIEASGVDIRDRPPSKLNRDEPTYATTTAAAKKRRRKRDARRRKLKFGQVFRCTSIVQQPAAEEVGYCLFFSAVTLSHGCSADFCT
ncbi:hypothetical protein LSAT2_008501 [Lamellibrachia satsuma]|nr:hypothetical protein LSAT2_008501 [Lamellibrachia satsuma]